MTNPRSATLLGRDHILVGARGVVAEGAAAIAISRGGAGKRYEYTDPNEDATGFAFGEGGSVLVVADGHYGCYGAEHAVKMAIEQFAPTWTAATTPYTDDNAWVRAGLEALVAINNGVIVDAETRNLPDAPTTLSIAVLRAAEGRLVAASVGDSHLFRVTDSGEATDLGWSAEHPTRTHFLGSRPETLIDFSDKCSVHCAPLAGARAVVLATDGLSERGIGLADPDRAVAESVLEAARTGGSQPALAACKGVLARAQEAQRSNSAGDNIAVATTWLAPGPR